MTNHQASPIGLSRFVACTLGGLGMIVACTMLVSATVSIRSATSRKELLSIVPRESTEHGFVTSSTCKACHPEAYGTWHATFHRTMTQYASPVAVVGDFRGIELEYFGKTYRLERQGETFWVHVGDQSRRIVQTTGSHHYQMYWLEGDQGNRLENLPFVFLIDDQKWVRRNDVFMVPPELAATPEGLRIWNNTCIDCHTTHGQPRMDDEQLTARTVVGEIGIACESCHGPATEHVAKYSNPLTRYRARLSGTADNLMVNPALLAPNRSSQVCGQCHSVFGVQDRSHWNAAGLDYRAGDDLHSARSVLRHPTRVQQPHNQNLSQEFLDKYFWSDGMIRVSGREYNGLIETPCFQRGEMSCLSCHSMHSSDPVDQLKRDMTGDRACLQCHSDFENDISAHTHHAEQSSGSRCYNCHMPHTTYGLVKAIRSHEIDSPGVMASIATGRPNSCNLCHLDRTLGWTKQHLSDWYGISFGRLNEEQETISAALQWMLAGDAGQRAIVAWHVGWDPALDASGDQWIAPFLSELLNDQYSVVRSIAGRSIKKLPGMHDLEYDYTGPEESRKKAAADVIERWSTELKSTTRKHGVEVLMTDEGIDYGRLFNLLNARDNRPVDLLE